MTPATLIAWASLAATLALTIPRWRGGRQLRFLADLPLPAPGTRLPRVSVIAPARNEARNIDAALHSWRGLAYPDYEVIVVDDRSSDATPEILARLAASWPGLSVVTVTELPDRWLGKNHANHVAAARSTGEWILFTDADVLLAPQALTRAVAYATEQGLDHLVVGPEAVMPGRLLGQFPVYFGILFLTLTRPWKARDRRSGAHVGVGAFNLVRASAYRAIGGHEPVRLRPDDDLKLGKVLKLAGYHQDFVVGRGQVRVEWYASWRELQTGLMKNLYAGVDYRATVVLAGIAANLVLGVWPLCALTLVHGVAFYLNLAMYALGVIEGWVAARYYGTARWAGFAMPLYSLIGAWLMARALFLTHWNDGIRWRDTHYPLEWLRSNRP